jgi:DNA-binding NtrC family response regulator
VSSSTVRHRNADRAEGPLPAGNCTFQTASVSAGGAVATILVMDDEPLVGEAIAKLLTTGGHIAFVATRFCGVEALQRRALRPRDHGSSDVRYLRPGPALKRRRPEVPVIVLTGRLWGGLPRAQDEPIRLGACRFMEKPMSRVTLLSAVANYIAAAKLAGAGGG